MKSFTVCALFAAGVSAVPFVAQKHAAMHHYHEKRDVVWVTETDIDTVTIPVTKTVWVDEIASTKDAVYHHKSSYEPTTTAQSASSVQTQVSSSADSTSSSSSVYVAPTTSSSSVYVAPTTSSTSVYVAPTTSTSAYVAPTSTSVYSASSYVASTTSTSSAAAATSSSSASGDWNQGGYNTEPGTSNTGDVTYYADGEGACGYTNTTDQTIIAISHTLFDAYTPGANPNDNTLCGRWVSITGVDGGSYAAQVVDRCVGCATYDIDLSEGLFDSVTNNGEATGRFTGMTWVWS